MQLVITHLTRMYNGNICVAGVDQDTRRHVRPVLRGRGIPNTSLAVHGGPFAVGAIVDFGVLQPCGQAPEVEDCHFRLEDARKTGEVSEADLRCILNDLSRDSLTDIFDDCLSEPDGFDRSLATPKGHGLASLGVWRPQGRPRIVSDWDGKPRLTCAHAGRKKRLAITDVRLFEPDMLTLDAEAVQRLRWSIENAGEILLCVGLGRPWAPEDSDLSPMHWLQVNGIHAHKAADPDSTQPDDPLLKELKRWRYRVASARGLPAYCILNNAALEVVCRERPDAREALLALKGFGAKTVEQYGDDILEIVRRHGAVSQ